MKAWPHRAAMGLALEVGIVADLEQADPEGAAFTRNELDIVNRALAAAGLKTHREPTSGPGLPWSANMAGYNTLHHLRRIAAHLWAGETKLPEPVDDPVDPLLKECYRTGHPPAPKGLFGLLKRRGRPFSHLINHSDAEGYYVPIDFPNPVPVIERDNHVGSSIRLLKELDTLAEALQLPAWARPDDGRIQALIAERPAEGEPWQRHYEATYALVMLREAARQSIKTGAAIAFC